jgi:hypothetical protein
VTTTDTSTVPGWLVQAEREYTAFHAEQEAAAEEFAASLADEVNAKLLKLGITPATPAGTDGHGNLLPAQLVPASPERHLYGVYASYDEDEGRVYLLVGDYRPQPNGFYGLHASHYDLGDADAERARYLVACVRREGRRPESRKPAQPSADARAIVQALTAVEEALAGLARAVGRQ